MAVRTLNLHGLSKLKLDQDLIESSFDRVSRYYITARLINDLSPAKKPKLLDVGGLGSILPRILPSSKLTILDVDPNDDPHYVQGSAMDAPFKDGEFDAVITCDTLEHIPNAERGKFIEELVRVSKDLVVVAAPFDRGDAAQAEVDLNQFYEKLSGHEHRWLAEHIEIGIPTEKQVEKTLDKLGVNYVKFGHTDIGAWRVLMEANFRSECLEIETFRKHVATLNTYYNKNLLDHDFSTNSYRIFYVISKQGKISLEGAEDDNGNKVHTKLVKKEAELYGAAIDQMGQEFVSVRKKYGKASERNRQLTEEVGALNAEISAIKHSKGWKLLQHAYNARETISRKQQ